MPSRDGRNWGGQDERRSGVQIFMSNRRSRRQMWLLMLMLILIGLPGLAQSQIYGVGARPDENDASPPRQGVTFGSDGSSYIHTPGATFGSNGETYIHTPGATFASDGESYIHTPGATFGSDGTTYIHTPAATFSSDGNTFLHTPGATFASDGSSYIHVPSAAAVGATRMPFLYDRAAREVGRAATDHQRSGSGFGWELESWEADD